MASAPMAVPINHQNASSGMQTIGSQRTSRLVFAITAQSVIPSNREIHGCRSRTRTSRDALAKYRKRERTEWLPVIHFQVHDQPELTLRLV